MCVEVSSTNIEENVWSAELGSLTTPPVNYTDINIPMLTNCTECTRFVSNDNHCQG